MAFKGFRQPLVQEDMWDLNEEDSTGYINQKFQHHAQAELGKARIRYQLHMSKIKEKGLDGELRNGTSSGLAKGISQDVLMLVRRFTLSLHYITLSFIILCNSHMCSNNFPFLRGKWE